MVARLVIQDGNPVWISPSVVPSRDIVVSPNSSPSVSTVYVNSTDIFVYVKVENPGTLDLGVCSCGVTGPWTTPTFFLGFLANASGNATETRFGVTFTASPTNNSLRGTGINYSFGISASGRRAWAWSADGRFFAYVSSPNGPDWYLTIVALQDITRSNGSTISRGQVAASSNGILAGPPYWTNANFGWAGSKAVLASGRYSGGTGTVRSLTCPESPNPRWSELIPDYPGQVDWTYLVSSCASVVAFAPKRLTATAPPLNFSLVSTANAQPSQFRRNNAPTIIQSTGANTSITTIQHSANGVQVNTGNGTIINVDDPDCTLVGGGIRVRVDRVKASTLPSANLGIIGVGDGVLGTLPRNARAWIQIPNQSGWANQSDKHWCLLAQAFTSDGTIIPKPWNGQASNPPSFPVGNENCAQRNIEINP